MNLLTSLAYEMTRYEANEPQRIQHFLKVHAFARMIGVSERLDERTLFVLETAAYVHDIGILPALQKYGSCVGPLQEKEGVAPAREMLTRLGFDGDVVDRVVFLVAHHHTCAGVDGADWQILLEADYLVNSFEGNHSRETVQNTLCHLFRTGSGIHLLRTMYGLD